MGFGDWLSDIGDGLARGIADAAHYGNTLDRYINPLHVEAGSAQHPVTDADRAKYNTAAGNYTASEAQFGVEKLGAASVYVRDQALYHPLSTVLLQAKRMGGWKPGQSVPYFSTADWASAWKAADNITPGQAGMLGMTSFTNNPNDPNVAVEAEKAIDSPLEYYKPNNLAALRPDFEKLSHDQQQAILKKAGMPVVGNRYVEELRKSSTFYKYSSGVIDFGLTWYADPLIVAGKGLGAVAKARRVYKPIDGDWTRQSIDDLVKDSRFGKLQDYLWEHKDNPQLVNNLKIAEDSAMGPRFGHIVASLQSPEEVNLFLRTTLGDLDAMDQLVGRNALIEGRLAAMNDRMGQLDLSRSRWMHNPHVQQQIDQQIADLEKRINADGATSLRYNDILKQGETLDKVYLGSWQYRRALQKTGAQNDYRAGAAYGYKASRPGTFTPTPGLFGISKAGTLATPIDGGMIKQTIWGAGDMFSKPVTVVRALREANPNGWMSLDDITKDSVAELRAHVARIPNITPEARAQMVNDYLKTPGKGDRMRYLDDVETLAWAKLAEKHGMDIEAGKELYAAYRAKRLGENAARDESARAYSATKIEASGGQPLRVDEFEANGARTVIHPHTVSRLRNTHTLSDLDEIDKVLARHSSALSALRTTWAGNPDWIIHGMEFLTSAFKVSTLVRAGYIPRVLGDDVGSQWAAAGAAAMAIRFGWGVRNGATNAARALAAPWQAAKEQAHLAGIEYAKKEAALASQQAAKLRTQLAREKLSNARVLLQAQKDYTKVEAHFRALDPADRSPRAMGVRQQHQQKLSQLRMANSKVAVGPSPGKTAYAAQQEAKALWLTQYHKLAEQKVQDLQKWKELRRQGFTDPLYLDGKRMKVAFEGKEGEYYLANVSADESVGNIFSSNRQLLHGNLMRSFDHGGRVIRVSENAEEHADAWAHAINAQIVQDPLERMAVQGMDEKGLAAWLRRTSEGREYRRQIGLALATPEALAQRAFAEVNEYLPTWEIRQAALEGAVTPGFLRKAVPNELDRPEVHTGMIGMQSQGGFQAGLDRIQQKWFHAAATIPANRMSRHPLYNQLYEGHLKQIARQRDAQGGWNVADIDNMTTAARKRALRDMRKLVFDIAHRSDAAAALRFISPFFGATAEAFQRWGRIIADKPQVVGYAADFFNAPISAGSMQDGDGNHILPGGYRMVKDPKSGKWRKEIVPKGERWIVGRVPQWVVNSPLGRAFGVEMSSGQFALSQNSINLVTQGDPWFHPGIGPVVQIPVNKLVQDKPQDAEVARKLGILPFGPQDSSASFVTPATVRNFMTAFNTSDERYQAIKMQIMQRAIYEHENMHKPMPSPEKIASMTRDYWTWTAVSAFTQPFATQRRDAYQFYRDQYNELRRLNPETADQEFLDRFGESYFIFAQSQSKNETGVPATKAAFDLQQKYGKLLASNPELGALIIGPEGNGPFSPEVYTYQLNHPLTPGGSEMQRTKMSAEEALSENRRREGWTQFMAYMNRLNADLQKAGFQSFDDKGAEDLKARKKALVTALGEPLLPDGSKNESYNEEWSKDYFSFDLHKQDRTVAALTELVNSDLGKDDRRSDLQVLKTYLAGRQEITQELASREEVGLPGSLTAKKNIDLSYRWSRFVSSLVESNTNFGDLYHRYLSRDLGMDLGTDQNEEVQA